ncbi:MAG: helix-turn-helix transcriptional regulator [Lachnospiraceae bacterium]|nr:helix-turn-helix transcriptional regulator [Lachnospiraceae bacterium]
MKLDVDKMQLEMANSCFTISELAEKSNISRVALRRYITRQGNPKPATIGKIAKALNVQVAEIIVNTGAATPNRNNQDSESNLITLKGGGQDESNERM